MKTISKEELKEFANGKNSKDCTIEEAIKVSRKMGGLGRKKTETQAEQLARINRFRCGW